MAARFGVVPLPGHGGYAAGADLGGTEGTEQACKGACLSVEYFFYCRGRPGTEALLEELAEAHWSFMDGYA